MICLCGAFALGTPAMATVLDLPTNLVNDTLSETVPTAFAPDVSLTAADWTAEWAGPPIPGVSLALGARSLEWVRVADVIVLPRAHLVVEAEEAEAGQARNVGFSQAMTIENGRGSLDLPVALLSGPANTVALVVRRGGKELRGEVRLRFKPRFAEPHVYTDPSCSGQGVSAENVQLGPSQWLYVGCRLVFSEGSEHRTAGFEVYAFWDGAGPAIDIGGVSTPATAPSLWPLRLRAEPGYVDLKADGTSLRLSYHTAPRLHLGSLGVGLGPYSYQYDAPGVAVKSANLMATIYGGYFITEMMRVVAFGALAIHATPYTDFGVYLDSEYLKIIDRRLTINLMLGAHVLGFNSGSQVKYALGGPQGFELTFKDVRKGENLTAGAFIYPHIDQTMYYNVWLRYGSSKFFGEMNYISWIEPLSDSDRVYARSIGLSIGFPVARFL